MKDLNKRVDDIVSNASQAATSQIVDAATSHGFHWRNGLWFRLTPDDAIEIVERDRVSTEANRRPLPDRCVAIIPRRQWESIVAFVDGHRQTSEALP